MCQRLMFPLPFAVLLAPAIGFVASLDANAASAQAIDSKADEALERLKREAGGGRRFLKSAEGALVCFEVIKTRFGVGEYGEGGASQTKAARPSVALAAMRQIPNPGISTFQSIGPGSNLPMNVTLT